MKKSNESRGREIVSVGPPEMALKSVSIKGSVMDNFSDITLKQVYLNDISENIEAVYTFPLPDNASVYRFVAKTLGKEIAGTVMKREKALQEYGDAISAGDGAMLFESHRPNVFQVSLGQIGAGETVEVEIGYMAEIKFNGNEMRLLTPLLVAPRYIPAGSAIDRTGTGQAVPNSRVPDADMITPPVGRTGYRVDAEITLDIGCGAESVSSPSHQIKAAEDDLGWIKVSFSEESVKMDRDFIITAKFPKTRPERFLSGTTAAGETFSYISVKPELPESEDEAAREYIFLIDVSGSMSGTKLDEAKKALKICMRNLSEKDTFNIIAFEDIPHPFMKKSGVYDQASLEAATAWINGLSTMGGTEMLEAIKMSLADNGGSEKIVMLITDGEVGNESEIISYIKSFGKNSRFFTVGVDTAVNSHLINAAAEVSGGAAEFVYPGEPLDDKILRHFSRIGKARIDELSVSVEGLDNIELSKKMPQKIYSDDNLSMFARLAKKPDGKAIVKGRVCGAEYIYATKKIETIENGEMFARLWAMGRISELTEYETTCNRRLKDGVKNNIIELSEKYGVLSQYTAFFARITRENKLSGMPETSVVPVEMPFGWQMGGGGKFMPSIPFLAQAVAPHILNCFSPGPIPSGGAINTSNSVDMEYSLCDSDGSELREFSKPSISRKMKKNNNDDDMIYNKIPCEAEETGKVEMVNKFSGRGYAGDENDGMKIDVPEDMIASNYLKELSMTQNADGSFGGVSDKIAAKIEKTVDAVHKFLKEEESLGIYARIINKAVKFILDNENSYKEDAGVYEKIRSIVESCLNFNVLKQSVKTMAVKFLKKQ